MRITLAASDLHDALKQSAYARTTPLDAIKHVLIANVGTGHIVIEATDLATRTRITLPATVEEGGRMLIDGAKLEAIAGGGGQLTLNASGKAVRGRSRYSLPSMPPDEFPSEDAKAYEDAGIDAVALAAAIAQVEHAADDKDARPFCRSVFIANGFVAAGNGIVISAVSMPCVAPVVLIPVTQVRHLQGLLHETSRIQWGNVRADASGRRVAGLVRVEAGNTVVTITCIDAQPFDISQLVDGLRLPPARLVVKRRPLMDAVRRFAPFVVTYSKGDSGVVLVNRGGQVSVADGTGDDANREDITEHVAAAEGGDFSVGLAHRHLLGVLGSIGAEEVDLYPESAKPNLLLPHGADLRQVAHLIAPQMLRA